MFHLHDRLLREITTVNIDPALVSNLRNSRIRFRGWEQGCSFNFNRITNIYFQLTPNVCYYRTNGILKVRA